MSAIEDLTVGEIIGWVMLVAAVVGFMWKGLPLARKTSRFIDTAIGYTDPSGERHPGLAEQIARLATAVESLKAALKATPTRAELAEIRAEVDALAATVRLHHPEA